MQILKLAKGGGRFRTIYLLPRPEREKLAALIPEIEAATPPNPSAHGFCRGRSIVTNAQRHAGFRFTLSFDFEDFFDSVTAVHLERTPHLRDRILFDGAIRQGPPTSPAASNLAAEPFDCAIRAALAGERPSLGEDRVIAFTRYADDLSFSFDQEDIAPFLHQLVHATAAHFGFRVNAKKEHLQDARRGRRIITGVAVDETLHPPRWQRRRLRAAIHQHRRCHAAGLAEFCRLRPPGSPTQKAPPQVGVATPTRAGSASADNMLNWLTAEWGRPLEVS